LSVADLPAAWDAAILNGILFSSSVNCVHFFTNIILTFGVFSLFPACGR